MKTILAAEPLVSAIDKALAVIQSPLLCNESSSGGFVYVNNSLITWYVTLTDDFSQVDPSYRLARNILDTLLPCWEEKYGKNISD